MKTLSQSLALAASISLALAACSSGDEDKGYGQPIGGAAEEAAATRAIDSINSLRSFQDSGGSDDLALASVTLGFADVSTLISAKFAAEFQGGGSQYLQATDELEARLLELSPTAVVAIGGENTASALGDDCVTVSGDTITYNNCSWIYGSIDGWITARDNFLSFDLKVVYEDDQSYSFSLDMEGSIEATETHFVGDFKYDIDWRFDQSSISYNLDGEFDVQLSAGCAVGGFLEIHGSIDVETNGNGSAAWDGWVRAEFGPSCGQVRVY